MKAPDGEETIFAEALRLPPEERAAYLAQSTGGNAELRQRIESLLGSYAAGDFLEQAAAPQLRPTVHISVPLTEKPGDTIGRYKLLQQIGEGGCGVVYMAEQLEPVRRRVALKIIKLGMDTKSVIARFEAERQAVALMDHPNIAKVFDAGATDTGRPYFVMELVRGMKITDYCDEAKLSTRARLDLFTQVCQAIQHAHQKGIIHRDIKPSNVLVSVNDGIAVPKVIDFGIAKATSGQQLTDKTVFTAFEQFIGTPAYMSPEQALISNVDIDTRSDIYALGVLLYELLTGKTPFDGHELLAIGLDEMRRTILEQEPPRPSTRLSTFSGQELSTTAQRRGLEAPKLVTELRGDLDWIVMKCLEKDRARRYDTANCLADDIQRHLSSEPVVACPPDSLYRFKKMVRRNKLAFAAGSAVAASLMIGLTLSTLLFFRERGARKQAREQAAIAQAVNDFLQRDLLRQASMRFQAEEHFTPESNLTVRAALDRAAERVDERFKDQPLTEAAVRMAIGEALSGVGEDERAVAHVQRALKLRQEKLGPNDRDTLKSMHKLGVVSWRAGKREPALSIFEETLKLRKIKLGPHDRDTLKSMDDLAHAYLKYGKFDQAIRLQEETLKLQKATVGPDNRDTLKTMDRLAWIYQEAGKLDEAVSLFEETLKLRRARLGRDHLDTLESMFGLGTAYVRADKLDKALPLLEETLELHKARLEPDDQVTLWSMNNLAAAYRDAGKNDKAVPLFEETLKLRKAKLPPNHPDTMTSIDNLANSYALTGKAEQAENLFTEALAASPQNERAVTELLRLRGELRARCAKWKEAVADLSRARDANPDDSYRWHELAPLLAATGQLEAYREHCRKSLERFGKSTNPVVAERIAKDCLILPNSGAELDVVAKLADTAAAATNHPFTPWFALVKGLAEYRQGRFLSAIECINKTLTETGKEFVRDVQAYAVLAMAHHQLKQTDEAHAAFAKGAEIERMKLAKLESGYIGENWLDWILAHVFMREAKEIMRDETKITAKSEPKQDE